MDLELWHGMLNEAVYWQPINEHMARDLFDRTVSAWAFDSRFYVQGPENIDLVDIYEKYRVVATLKGSM